MVNSIAPIQNSCVCLYAIPGPRKRTKPNNDQYLIFEVSISLAAVQKNPVRKLSPRTHQTVVKTFQHPRRAFLSATRDEQRDIIHNIIIQGLETPDFPLEFSINWGLDFPPDESKLKNLDEIVTNKLSGIAHRCADNHGIGYMDIRIRKLEKVENEEYQELLCCREKKQPLDDWIVENQGNVKLSRGWCLGFIYKLHRESPEGNNCYGLRSVKMERDDEERDSSGRRRCPICMKGFKRNSQGIRMPCSHIFHGFCIFKWLEMRPTCPLCRFKLFSSTPRQSIG